MQDKTARCGAPLSGRAESTPEHALERQVEVGVVHHDHRVLAAHFERDSLVHPPAGLGNGRAGRSGTGEGDERNVGMLHQRPTRDFAASMHQLDHFGREARLEGQLD